MAKASTVTSCTGPSPSPGYAHTDSSPMRNVPAATSTSVAGWLPAPAVTASDAGAAAPSCRRYPGAQHAPSMRRAYRRAPYDLPAMPEHVHVHVPHELGEPGEATSNRERWLEIVAALMLSLATLGIAWSGYQAAKWSGLQAQRYTQASTARSFANRAATLGAQD